MYNPRGNIASLLSFSDSKISSTLHLIPVSYTHLDVYKRQILLAATKHNIHNTIQQNYITVKHSKSQY